MSDPQGLTPRTPRTAVVDGRADAEPDEQAAFLRFRGKSAMPQPKLRACAPALS